MFLDVHEGGPAHAAGIHPGDLLLALNGEEIRPPSPPMFRMGEEIKIAIQRRDGSQFPGTLPIPNPEAKERPMSVPRAISFSKLPDGIGLLKATMFPGAVGIDVAREITNAMEELRDCSRLIIDLRGNTGGGIGGLRLMSYLTLRFKFIQRDRSMVLVTEGLGPQPFHGRTVVLINEHTHSAAEMVASFARENRLATLVGTRTAGEVLGGANFKLPCGYVLRMPVAGWYTWKGECIEGRGVQPDVSIENSPESLAMGVDAQVGKALEVVKTL